MAGWKIVTQEMADQVVKVGREHGKKDALNEMPDINSNVVASILSANLVGAHTPERVAKDLALFEKHGLKVTPTRAPRVRKPKVEEAVSA